MSFFGRLFGAPEAVDRAMGAAERLLDDAFYTGEEKAKDKAAAVQRAQEVTLRWVESTEGSRLARRVLAFAITFTWLGMKMLSWLFGFLAVWAGKRHDQLIESANLAQANATEMTAAVMLILGFYFAAPYMGDLAKGALQKFSAANSAPSEK